MTERGGQGERSDTFRVALERALACRPAGDPPSPFRTSLAQALDERSPADDEDEVVVDLRDRALLTDAIGHRADDHVVDLRTAPDPEGVVRPLGASST